MFLKKYGIHILLILTFLGIIILPRFNAIPDAEKEKEALAAASAFFTLIDAEEFEQSWQSAAPLLREKVTQENWVQNLKVFRTVLGAPVKREQTDSSYSVEAKDSPDGEYIMLTFNTRFERQEKATETMTVMLTENLRWQVAGYFVK